MKKIVLLMFLPLVLLAQESDKKNSQPCEFWITVFIHGTIKPQLAYHNLVDVLRDRIENTTYEKAISTIRRDPFFYHLHAIQDLGLKPITSKTPYTGARAIAHLYQQISHQNKQMPTLDAYYTFGWSGLLSQTARYEAAKQLYASLEKLIHETKQKKGISPRIRLICYSHGGNIALNLARAQPQPKHDLFAIDELILLGTPLQRDTDYLVADPLFKQVYNVYSSCDRVQASDFLSFKQFGSYRTFQERTTFKLPTNLKQIRINVAKILRTKPDEELKLPAPSLRPWTKRVLINPGHTELWSLGWTPTSYRQKFPLYPLPVCTFLSYIITCVNQTPHLSQNVEITIYPEIEKLTLQSMHEKTITTAPFISHAILTRLANEAQTYKPSEDFYDQYRRRTSHAVLASKTQKSRVYNLHSSTLKKNKQRQCLH